MKGKNEFGESPEIPYDFPLRPGVRARMRLPADLTVEEAERLCGVIQALAFPSGGTGKEDGDEPQ